MKRKSGLIAIFGILMIVAGGIMSFVTSFAKDVSNTKENIEIIEGQYKSFKQLMEAFNGERENLYETVMNELFIEDVEDKYSSWVTTFQSYETVIFSVSEYQNMLEKRCLNVLYSDSKLQSKCDSMIISYETAMNYYIKDVHKFNELITLYNDGVGEELKKDLYDLKNYNYIDFNDDGKYLGK